MIPPDLATRLQASADVSLRPVAPTQEITDKLSGLSAGDRVMATIQALLPNGTYRAMINQRNLTLALPFAAKPGDALELQVTESDGKLALAVVAERGNEAAQQGKEAASATLSRTGQLISQLFGGRVGGGNTSNTPNAPISLLLNGNQPIAGAQPGQAADLLPALKQAIAQSGMFYESHQAEWLEGRFPKAALLLEPQGKLSSPAAFLDPPHPEAASAAGRSPVPTGAVEQQAPARAASETSTPSPATTAATSAAPTTSSDAGKAVSPNTGGQTASLLMAPQTQPIVQQQLEALATQTFAWQGQIWPGQQMHWEIEEDAHHQASAEDEDVAAGWRTRLALHLPVLGSLDARIQLQGSNLNIAISASDPEALQQLQGAADSLREHLHQAGLNLTALGITPAADEASDGTP